MVSNGYSKRRGPLRRPKVCESAPNPGRCHPPPDPPPPSTLSCSLLPSYQVVEDPNYGELSLAACDTAVGEDTLIDVLTEVEGGDFSPLEGLENCNEVSAEFTHSGPGLYALTATFTSEASNICIATASVLVVSQSSESSNGGC